MHLRLLFIITLCNLTYSLPTYSMLLSSIKKLNQIQRYKSILSCFDHNGIKQAPYNLCQFLKYMPKELNFTEIKNKPIVHEIVTLDSENKNLMLAHVMDFMSDIKCYDLCERATPKTNEILMAMACLISVGANPDTLIHYWHDSPALILAYEAHFYPLQIALELNNIDFMEFLLNHGANVHGPEYQGNFFAEPIFYAENVEAAKILFKYGLNLDSKDRDYSQVIDSAIRSNKPQEVITLLKKNGAKTRQELKNLE